MALLNDSYSKDGKEFFQNFFSQKERFEKEFDNLRMSTTFIQIDDIVERDDSLFIKLKFKGHAGYPGGEITKELSDSYFTTIKNDVLLFLLITLDDDIKRETKEYFKLLETDNE